MFILSFSTHVTMIYEKSSSQNLVHFEPFRPYVLSDSQFEKFSRDPSATPKFYKTAKLEPQLQNFIATAQKPGRVFFYTGGGGFGDQIMAWPVAKYLHTMGYEVDVYCDPGNESCWWMFPWVRQVQIVPVLKTVVDNYRQFCLFQEVTNMDESHDQSHPVDVMLKRIGIDPMSVPPESKVVKPAFTPAERNQSRALLYSLKIPFKRFAIVQLSASVPLRSFAPDEAMTYLRALSEAYPDIAWIHLTDKFNNIAYKIRIQESGLPNVFAHTFNDLRECWAAIAIADVAVAVDSMVVHVAGSSEVPTVGIWGPVHPLVRTKYYKNHLPLFKPSVCSYAPCFYATSPNLPPFCPPKNPPAKSCQVMQAATPQMVVDAVREVLVNKLHESKAQVPDASQSAGELPEGTTKADEPGRPTGVEKVL